MESTEAHTALEQGLYMKLFGQYKLPESYRTQVYDLKVRDN
jgi:hypothetical protein